MVLPDDVASPTCTGTPISTAVRWKKVKPWFESSADPGGIKGIKIQRHHHDPGTENKGAMPGALAEDNVIDSSGGTDVHTDWTFVKNANRLLQTMQASVNCEGVANQP